MEEKYIIRKQNRYDSSDFSYLILTEEDKYEWGCREDATLFIREHLKEIQEILAFGTSIETI